MRKRSTTPESDEQRAVEVEVPPQPAATEQADALGPAAEDLAPAVEALLISMDKPLPAGRLAEALGLVPQGSSDDEEPDATPEESEAAAEKRPGRKGGKQRPLSPAMRVRAAVEALNADYAKSGRSFRIEAVAGGYRIMTLPRFAPVLEALHGRRERASLSRAAIETLAIVAYKQPITRATLESIRGVACGEVLRSLLDRRLITITGRAEELGRPILYGTSKRFLETFGLSGLKDLPSVEELKMRGGHGAESGDGD